MPTWLWVLIAVAAVAVVAVIVWQALATRRTRDLQERFGPEYDRTTGSAESKKDAESELAARAERRDRLDIRPLPPAARDRYADRWDAVQTQFVDAPGPAVASADALVSAVMAERGYPMDDFEQRAADVSVDHPQVVQNYRQAQEISRASERGQATTEDLRQAMQHYRALFHELLGEDPADQRLTREGEESRAEVPR